MYPSCSIRPYRNKYLAYVARNLIHRMAPDSFFIKYMGRQTNPVGHPAYALTFDFDFEKDIEAFPVVLDLLNEFNVKAGMAVIGKFVEKYPEIHYRAVQEGHELINHTYTHPDNPHWAPDRFFNSLSYEEQKEEIRLCHEIIKDILDYKCVGFRTPHYGNLHTENVYPILAELGYKYSSSTAACGYKGYGAPTIHSYGIIEIPTGCSKNYPLAIFDSWNMLRKKKPFIGNDEGFLKEFSETISIVAENNLFLTHYFDPYDVIENGKLKGILNSLSEIKAVLYKDIITTTH